MAAHRYWRVALPLTYGGGDIEIGEFHLFAGATRVDAGATLTCSTTPVSGTLADLKDDDLDTLVELTAGSVLTWDLGSGNDEDVTNLQIASGDTEQAFPSWLETHWSDDAATWTAESTLLLIGPTWPGARTKTSGTPLSSKGFLLNPLSTNAVSNGLGSLPFSGVSMPSFSKVKGNFNFNLAIRGRIVGTVKRDADPTDIPMRRRVRLYRDRDGMFIREGWSDTAGDYVFEYIEEWEAYTVIAHDYQFNYRAVVADNLTLANGGVELMA